MRFSVISHQLPEREGTAPGRALLATCEGLLAEGHEVDVRSWARRPPAGDLPPWCTWEPLPPEPVAVTKARGLLRPRHDVTRAGWRPAGGAVAIADDVPSFAAVEPWTPSVATVHYRTDLDAAALGRWRPESLQERRAERRLAVHAGAVLGYSRRVAAGLGPRARFVPIAYPVPDHPLPPVDGPIAALLAGWDWPPNRAALGLLLDAWPAVRARVPAARLLLAGRGIESVAVGTIAGVEVVGEVAAAADLLARAAVVAFPCPATSGPKVKVLEGLAHGRPVVTTPAGAEGLLLTPGDGLVVSGRHGFAGALAGLLVDPARASELGRRAHTAAARTHAPRPAARARVAALSELGVT